MCLIDVTDVCTVGITKRRARMKNDVVEELFREYYNDALLYTIWNIRRSSGNQYPSVDASESCWSVRNSGVVTANSFRELWAEGRVLCRLQRVRPLYRGVLVGT